ncbi:MAG TPA: GDSL-type esterase/lipase family protein [Acidimicrobiales bacterium]|nr:GDSL-type esterase/lipase family protein [Acidimicrobiales bacterium]
MRLPSGPPPSPGERPAGQVLVVMVAGLLLAALVNADALVERAQHKALGPGRDRSLALWHPVQDVAHITQLHRFRQLGDDLIGDGTRGSGDLAASAAEATATTVDPDDDRPPELRAPSADDPLRVYIAGDSVVRDAGESFLRLDADDPLLAASLHYEIGTGLSRLDVYDWPAALVGDAASQRAEVVLLMFGGNDAQGIVDPGGTVHPTVDSPGWREEYGRRVGLVMDALRAEDRLLLWVGQPPMRDDGFDARIAVINDVVAEEAEGRAWVHYVDTRRVLGDERGRYVERRTDVDGPLRQGDGIHLSRAGADLLARHLRRMLADELAGTGR